MFTNEMNGWLLQALFFETTKSDRPHCKYTLKDYDSNGYQSLYRLYMEANDPTEYTFANQHMGGWEHWTRLCECTWFQPYVTRWRHELELRIRANALKNILSLANAEGKDKLAANKLLLGSWGDKTEARGRGRPSKAEIKKEAHRLAEIEQNLTSDFERIQGRTN